MKSIGFLPGVEKQVERVVPHLLAPTVPVGDGVAVEEHAEGLGESRAPVGVGHRLAVGSEPSDVHQAVPAEPTHRAALEEPPAAEDRDGSGAAEMRWRVHSSRSASARSQSYHEIGVVLAVGVVVALLGAPELVARQAAWGPPGKGAGWPTGCVAVGPGGPRPLDRRSVPRPRNSTTGCHRCRPGCPRRWPGCASRCTRPGRASGESVVRGDEVDAGLRTASGRLIEVRAAGEALGQLTERAVGLAPVVPDRITEMAVPFRPQRREVADLITTIA